MAHALKVPKHSPADLVVARRQAAIDRTRGVLSRLAPGRSLSDELIAQRRVEARAEDQTEAAEAAHRRRRAKT